MAQCPLPLASVFFITVFCSLFSYALFLASTWGGFEYCNRLTVFVVCSSISKFGSSTPSSESDETVHSCAELVRFLAKFGRCNSLPCKPHESIP